MRKTRFFKLELNFILLAVLLLSLSGCMGARKGSGPVFSVDEPIPDKTIIYHYRTPKILKGIRAQYDVLCNDAPITRIGNGGYFKHTIDPGEIVIRTKTTAGGFGPFMIDTLISNAKANYKEMLTFKAEAGRSYYLRYTVLLSDEKPLIEHIDSKEALQEMKGLRSFKTLEERLREDKEAIEEFKKETMSN